MNFKPKWHKKVSQCRVINEIEGGWTKQKSKNNERTIKTAI